MISHCAQGQCGAVFVQRIVFQVDGHLIKSSGTDLIAEHLYFNHITGIGHSRIQRDGGSIGRGSVGVVVGLCGQVIGLNKIGIDKQLNRRHRGVGIHCYIQQQRSQFIGKSKLLSYLAFDHSSLPTDFFFKCYATGILAYQSGAECLSDTLAVHSVVEGIRIEIVVKYNVA